MSKLIVSVAFLANVFLLAHGSTVEQRSTSHTFPTENAFTVSPSTIRSLYTVSHSENNYKVIELDKYYNRIQQICDIVVDPASEIITGRLRAAAIYRKIVVWGKRSEELVNNGNTKRTKYTVLLIDPMLCTYSAIIDLTDEVPSSNADILPDVMVHKDSFDIFFPSQEKCSPCSFDINGGKFSAPAQLKHEGSPAAPFFLREMGTTNTYVYLYNFDNGTAVMRLLNRHFMDVRPVRLNFNTMVHRVITAITYPGNGSERPLIGIIYVLPESPRRPTLLVLDEKFDVVYMAIIPLLDKHDFVDASLVIDTDIKSAVTVIQQSEQSQKITMMGYDKHGRITTTGGVIGELKLHENYEVQSFYDKEYYYCITHDLSHNRTTNIYRERYYL